MNKELYVSTTPHETKVALVEDDQLAEVYFERENEYTLAGSIYKGRVTRVLPGMQSAFVDIGLERDAFLYVSDFLELQDEEEDAEFGDVKVTGSTLVHANGLILAEPQLVEVEEADEPQEQIAAADTDEAEGEGKDAAGAPRWRGRRRRRGRRGGRDRVAGETPVEGQPVNAAAGLPAEPTNVIESEQEPEEAEAEVPAPPPARPQRKRELRGFEPRGLVVHGLARTVDEPEPVAEPEEVAHEVEAEAPVQTAPTSAPVAPTFTPMLLPGESISKYNRAEGEAPAAAPAPEAGGAADDSDRGFARGRDRDRGADRGGGRGRRGERDRDRGRGRDREHEPREPREHESFALPENYTPIVLPGESISKYRDVEPIALSTTEAVEPIEAIENLIPVEQVAEAQSIETPVAESVIEHQVVPEVEVAPDEPLSSASYSGVSGLPSLTQRHSAEVDEPEVPVAEEPVQPTPTIAEEVPAAEAHSEHVQTESVLPVAIEAVAPEVTSEATSEAKPEVAAEVATTPVSEPVAEPVVAEEASAEIHSEEAHSEASPDEAVSSEPVEGEAKPQGRGRRSWRDRVSKIFGAAHEATDQTETHETEAHEEKQPAVPVAEKPTNKSESYDSELGSFVIEGGNVEHEEFDEEETEMPVLAEHRDRYEEGEIEEEPLEDGNGSQFGTAVRESGEESELEDEEYDFGGEEFEESELLADEVGEEDEEAVASESPEAPAAPAIGRQRPERFDRRERRGRRGAPPQRGGGRPTRARQQTRALPLISELLKEGQEILVQIAKEPIGKKGARITSHIALPGRFLVYMPTVNHIGVSRKISSEEERQRLKRIVSSERENGHGGFIVRTAASNIKEDELRADIRFLKHLWTEIRTRAESSKSPSLIYHDLNLVERILRDQVTSDFSQIWVDNESEYERVVRFASRFQPSLVRRIKLYTKDAPLYEQFGINEEINKSLKSKVWLKSGGYIVINQTEALVAIDINTGKYVGKTARLEDTIVKTNCDAVKEIVRQIRLRDLGGIIVVDFIDMDERKNRQKVMQALEEAMKADRAPSKILQFNDFGLVAITRKRVKQSLERTLGTPCPYCDATGFVKSVQTVCNEIYVEMRKVRRHVESKEVMLRVNPEVAKELKGGNGKWLQEMEELLGHPVLIKSDAQLHQEQFDMNY